MCFFNTKAPEFMLFDLFKPSRPPVDETTIEWIFDSFQWFMQQFDHDYFVNNTQLIVPDNTHFPGRAGSTEEMIQMIFDRVAIYAGMSHWKFQLNNAKTCEIKAAGTIIAPEPVRGDALRVEWEGGPVPIYYDPQLINNPEALIASFAHSLAHYLGQTANEPPPGGAENWPYTTELLALFMGFGLMFANSAFATAVRSCGGCGGANANRQSFLSQYDMSYALALFCQLKGIQPKIVKPYLKSSLFSFYRRCEKDLIQHKSGIESLINQ